jgi:hypothetical protein
VIVVPGEDRLTVTLPASSVAGTLDLFDATGRHLRQWPVTGARMDLSLAGLAPGVLTLVRTDQGRRGVVRFAR